ncbi:MAG: quinone oxidoreductase [Myxococcota bacterium]|nr:quinone oxidoreductase [Myxococcota bacterium]
MNALVFDSFGGPEVLSLRTLPDPQPGRGEAVVAMRAIGLNFADVYRRRGNYHLVGSPPYILGYEGAGTVLRVGPEATVREGDRVAFADSPWANAEEVLVPCDKLLPLPEEISFEVAAAVLLQGLTAQYLVHDSHPLRRGEVAVIHAAAGGVGSLLVQLCRHLGARVVGLTSTEAKRDRILRLGADAVFASSSADWPDEVRALTGGRGADVVFDSIGKTLLDSLRATRTGGRVVFFGMAGGNPPPVDPRVLMDASLSLTGGDLWNVLTSREERRARAATLFGWVRSGTINVEVSRTFPLKDGAGAHRVLESGSTTGKLLLIP